MNPRIAIPAIVAMIASVPLSAQSDFEYSLNSYKGNKIVLLGQWSGADLSKWKEVLDSDAIYGHGFQLLTRDRLIKNNSDTFVSQFAIKDGNIEAFERWIRQKYGLASSARWAAIGMDNKLIVTGAQAPSTKEFDEMLMQRGIKTPQRILRDFLRENPGHIDAMTDLLTEVRRRALHVMPLNPTEDLDDEKDLRTWAVMSTETDKVFSGDWLGIDISFFRPDKVQPERYSKLMRDVFKKHISKVEQAIALNPMNGTLWNIWAWMAQCNPDYKRTPFINSIEPTIYPYLNSYRTIPPESVCAWLVEEAKAKADWGTIARLGKVAMRYRGEVLGGSERVEWTPGNSISFAGSGETIKDYPARAYAAYLEALLRLGNIDQANSVYDEMMRKEGRAGNAPIAASAARAAGLESLAKNWEMGEQTNKVPYAKVAYTFANGFPSWHYYTQSGKSYSDGFTTMVNRLDPPLRNYFISKDDLDTIGWKADDGDRWALIAGDLSVLEQGYGMPEPEILQAMLKRHNVKDEAGYRRDYMAEHGARSGLKIDLAFNIISSWDTQIRQQNKGSNTDQGQDDWAEVCTLMNEVLSSNPEILVNLPGVYRRFNSILSHQGMKSLSTKLLANIETLLEKKPSSNELWGQWLFWRRAEGSGRPIEPMVESIKASPIAKLGTVPPVIAIDEYYDECRENGKWAKVISLLKMVWDRDFTRITEIQEANPSFKASAPAANKNIFSGMTDYEADMVQRLSPWLGDNVAIPLIEAYLNDGKPNDAKDIFDAWLGVGGTFKDISKIIELARKLGQERLALEWETKAKK
ncbi:MAG: hypothetical protein LBC63_00070 [Holophagales bacterium]|jgi:pentatricopeptide repeat protein|nr:hypothetical protein [Holophagales bacterium]